MKALACKDGACHKAVLRVQWQPMLSSWCAVHAPIQDAAPAYISCCMKVCQACCRRASWRFGNVSMEGSFQHKQCTVLVWSAGFSCSAGPSMEPSRGLGLTRVALVNAQHHCTLVIRQHMLQSLATTALQVRDVPARAGSGYPHCTGKSVKDTVNQI